MKQFLFYLSSDSCKLMCLLCKKLLETNQFMFAFGCAAHMIHNVSLNIAKLPSLTFLVKKASVVVNKICTNNLLCSTFEGLQTEKYSLVCQLVLFSCTRWSSMYLMFKRILFLKSALVSLRIEILASEHLQCISPVFPPPNS